MSDIARILDANANRAREALRVMEEAARFLLDDAELTGELKALRHDLAAVLAALPDLPLHRDTPGDVGTATTTEAERFRASVADVAVAAGKRLSEALRAIEEYAKVLSPPDLAGRIEALRYRGYELEQRLNVLLRPGRPRQWRLCLLLTESLCRLDWREVLGQSLDAGADCVQVREKELGAAPLLKRVNEVVSMCRRRASVIVNDRPDVALLAGADGVHLGQTDLPVAEVRKFVGRQLLIGVSTSRLEEAKRAKCDGADYCGVGPMFPTTTKHKDVIVGPDYLRNYVAWDGLPHLAIGGITPDNAAQLAGVGAKGLAVSSCVCASDEPGEIVAKLLGSISS